MWLLHPAVPEPHWIIRNPQNGHAQAGWMIEPVRCGAGSRDRPVKYLEAVRTSLEKLTSSDQAFTRFLVRNPVAHSPAGDVTFGSRILPYTLGDLMQHMQSYTDPFDDDFEAWQPHHREVFAGHRIAERADEGGRNNTLFYATRAELWRRFDVQGIAPSKAHALAFATDLNTELASPLPAREVQELAYSAVRQVLRGKGKNRIGPPDPWLSRLGRKGGQAISEAKRAAAVQNATKATLSRQEKAAHSAGLARKLRSLGESLAAIARAIGKTVRTVQRYLAEPEEQHDISEATGSHGHPPTPLSEDSHLPAAWSWPKSRMVALLDFMAPTLKRSRASSDALSAGLPADASGREDSPP
jgi:Sec-independent protein translocase protein TatA